MTQGIPIGATIMQSKGSDQGTFTGLNFGPGFRVRPQGQVLGVDLSATQRSVVFKPGTPSAGDTVATWAEVAALIASTGGLLNVFVDSSTGTPTVTSSVDCKGRTNFIAVEFLFAASGATINLVIDAGKVLTDPASFRGITLKGSGNDMMIRTTISALVLAFFDSQISVPTNNVPAISVAGDNSVVELNNSALTGNFAAVDAYIAAEGTVTDIFLRLIEEAGNISAPDNAMMVKGNAISLTVQTDGSAYLPAQTELVGSTQSQTLLLPPQAGITADRPATGAVGQIFFDTTLGLPIWWNGAIWVKADGTAA